jgi:hypothetical protein
VVEQRAVDPGENNAWMQVDDGTRTYCCDEQTSKKKNAECMMMGIWSAGCTRTARRWTAAQRQQLDDGTPLNGLCG